MSAYTDKMVSALQSKEQWTFADAEAFADEYSLSTRSVVSKIKSLGIGYTPKPKTVSTAGPRIRKADIVAEIATALDVDIDSIAGLDKADMRSLAALKNAIVSR